MRQGDFARSGLPTAFVALATLTLLGWLLSRSPARGASLAGPREPDVPRADGRVVAVPSLSEARTTVAAEDPRPEEGAPGEVGAGGGSSTLRLLVLDRAMQQPVPFVELHLEQGETIWEGRTDVHGRADATAIWGREKPP